MTVKSFVFFAFIINLSSGINSPQTHIICMSPRYDVIDWVGGYPFEVAKPEEIFDLCDKTGLVNI